jgi:hypothetical protein
VIAMAERQGQGLISRMSPEHTLRWRITLPPKACTSIPTQTQRA